VARYSGIFYSVGFVAASLLLVVACALICRAAGVMWLAWVGGYVVVAFALLLVASQLWLSWRDKRALLLAGVLLTIGFHWQQWSAVTPLAAEVLLLVPGFMVALYLLAPGRRGLALAGRTLVLLFKVAFGWLVPAHSAICRVRARIGPDCDLFRGITHLREGELDQAVLALDRHLRRKPKDIGGLTYATLSSIKLRRYDEGLHYLDAALAGDGHRQAELLILRALVLSAMGVTEDALRDIDAALVMKSENARFHCVRAFVLVQAERVDEALEVLKGPAKREKSQLSWIVLSTILSKKNDSAATADACSHAFFLGRTERLLGPMPWDETGEALSLVGMGKLEQGERAAIRTLARNPGDQEALLVQALVHTCRGETDEALRALEEIRPTNPFTVVQAARDPSFAPLAANPRFPSLLDRATKEYESRLLSVRRRPGNLADSAQAYSARNSPSPAVGG
jgi:tetratricopeptide (TPR) repeat protein